MKIGHNIILGGKNTEKNVNICRLAVTLLGDSISDRKEVILKEVSIIINIPVRVRIIIHGDTTVVLSIDNQVLP